MSWSPKATLALSVGQLLIFNVDSASTARLATELSARFRKRCAVAGIDRAAAVAETDGLIHYTLTGMAKLSRLPLLSDLLHPALWFAEIIYLPAETELLQGARKLEGRTLDGVGIAVFQAVRAFQLITGIEPDVERMCRDFLSM